MTKLFGLGVLGALGAGAYVITRAVKQRAAARDELDLDNSFDFGDIDQPVVVTEEVVVVTEGDPFGIAMELIPEDELVGQQFGEQQQGPEQQDQQGQPFEMPGRDAGPR